MLMTFDGPIISGFIPLSKLGVPNSMFCKINRLSIFYVYFKRIKNDSSGIKVVI